MGRGESKCESVRTHGLNATVSSLCLSVHPQVGVKIAWEGTGVDETGTDVATGTVRVRVE